MLLLHPLLQKAEEHQHQQQLCSTIEPGPIPTLTASTPAFSAKAAEAVILPATTSKSEILTLAFTVSITPLL